MNIFIILLIFSLFILIAISIYLFYLYRSKLYSDLDYICKYLKNNISFNKSNINTLLTNSFGDISATSRYILKNPSSGFSKIVLKDNKLIINDFYKSLGKGDVDFEINNLDYYTKIFEEYKGLSKEEVKSKGLLYFKLIIGLGLIVCILLI